MGVANTHSRWIRGHILNWQDHRKRQRLVVDGKDIVLYNEDFINFPVDDSTGDPTAWTCAIVEAGTGNSTFTQADASGGAGLITTDDNDNDGINAQLNGESFKLKTTNDLYFGAFGVTISNAAQSDISLGLAVTDTDILGNAPARIVFQSVDGSTDLKFALKQASETLSAAIATLADATAIDLEFYWDGSGVEVFVNGASVLTPAVTNKPTGELRVSWHFLNGLANAPQTCQIDRITCIQIGR